MMSFSAIVDGVTRLRLPIKITARQRPAGPGHTPGYRYRLPEMTLTRATCPLGPLPRPLQMRTPLMGTHRWTITGKTSTTRTGTVMVMVTGEGEVGNIHAKRAVTLYKGNMRKTIMETLTRTIATMAKGR